MDKLIRGAANFNRSGDSKLKSELNRLATEGQKPTVLLITCVDSRILPSIITNADPGDILTLRNIGNFVPMPENSWVGGDSSVAATVSFALEAFSIKHFIVLGHSECGGISELYARRDDFRTDALGMWLTNGRRALERFSTDELKDGDLSELNRLSQLNVLSSLEALSGHPEVRQQLDLMQLTLHGWWFDINKGKLLAHEPRVGRFVQIEDAYESSLSSTPTSDFSNLT